MKLSFSEIVIVVLCTCAIIATLFFKSSLYQTAPADYNKQLLTSLVEESPSQEIILHYHDRRPYHLTFKKTVHGLVADPINKAFESAGIPFSWRETPAKRQLSIIASNKDRSCAAGWFKTEDRLQFAQFSVPIYQDKPIVAITRADTRLKNSSGTLEEVFYNNELLLLVKSGYSYGALIDDLLQKYNPWKISTTVDNRGMLQMILNHRADYTLMAEEEAVDLLFFSGLDKDHFSLVSFSDLPLGNQRYVICTSQVEKEIIDKLNKSIKQVTGVGE